MHVNDIKEVVRILQSAGNTNKEEQTCLLGYVVGLEAPIQLTEQADDQIEWNSFFNDIPGEINEHYLINLSLAQDVANLTLRYRQAMIDSSDKIEQYAKDFLNLTGAAFGLLGQEGIVRRIRQVLGKEVEVRRAAIEEKIRERREAIGEE